MIVNSVDKTLNLNKGSLSNGIATAAGQQIKDECQQNHPSGVTEGNIVVTSSGSLPCKKICHACVPGYKPNKDNESKKVNNSGKKSGIQSPNSFCSYPFHFHAFSLFEKQWIYCIKIITVRSVYLMTHVQVKGQGQFLILKKLHDFDTNYKRNIDNLVTIQKYYTIEKPNIASTQSILINCYLLNNHPNLVQWLVIYCKQSKLLLISKVKKTQGHRQTVGLLISNVSFISTPFVQSYRP